MTRSARIIAYKKFLTSPSRPVCLHETNRIIAYKKFLTSPCLYLYKTDSRKWNFYEIMKKDEIFSVCEPGGLTIRKGRIY